MSDIAKDLHDTASRLFGDLCTVETVSNAEAGVWPVALWKAVDEAGLCDIPLMGDWQDACAALYAASYASAPLPLADTMLGRHLLNAVGIDVPEGPLSFVVLDEPNLTISNDRQLIDGMLTDVPFGSVTDHMVIVMLQESGTAVVVLLPAKSAQIETRQSIAGEWLDNMTFEAARVSGSVVVEIGEAVIDRYRGLGALTRCALITGAGKKVLEFSIQYSSERVQFGRPISAFQAVAFMISQITEEVAASTAIVEAAANCEHDEDAQQLLIAAAKTRAGEAATAIARMAHQIFGAMGMTMEHPLHHSTRRLWAWREEYGGGAILGKQAWAEHVCQNNARRYPLASHYCAIGTLMK